MNIYSFITIIMLHMFDKKEGSLKWSSFCIPENIHDNSTYEMYALHMHNRIPDKIYVFHLK